MSERYPSFESYSRRELRQALKKATPEIFEDVLRFLENDPKTFGLGYLKEMMWKYITRFPLSEVDIQRLEAATIQYLKRPMSREFKLMCQTMARIATSEFWELIESKLQSDNPREQVNAYCLFGYAAGIEAGEKRRLELNSLKYRMRSKNPPLRYSVEEVIQFVQEAENWKDGIVIRREPIERDLPIIYFDPSLDDEFATLDMQAAKSEILIPKLERILSTGFIGDYRRDLGWLYTIYLLRQIEDVRAVPLLVNFWYDKISYKFDGPTKGIYQIVILKTLKYYGTPQAVELLKQNQGRDRFLTDYFANGNFGWTMSYP